MVDTQTLTRFRAARSGFVPWGELRQVNPEVLESIEVCAEFSKGSDDLLQLLVSEGLSYNQVAKEMNFRGYRTAKGTRWTPGSIKAASRKILDTYVVRN